MQRLILCIFSVYNAIITTIRKLVIIFRGYNHILISITVYLALKDFIPIKTTVGMGAFIWGLFWLIVGAIAPDLDHPNSIASRFIIFPIFLIFSGHRKETHSLLALVICSAILWVYNPFYGLCFALSYILHLLVDTLTVEGIPWLYPWNKKHYSFKLTSNGSPIEYIVALACIQYLFLKIK